jgi:uncharacterized membrane protein YeaQ/YmgE (transglycosylase-associated protein family)
MCLIVAIILGIIALGSFLAVVGLVTWLLPVLVVGLIVGALASSITESKHGVVGDIAIGLAGSVVGGALLGILFHHHPPGLISLEGIVAALAGSVILLVAMKALR